MEEEFELIGESAEGKVLSIGAPEPVTTKFGDRRRIPVTIELPGSQTIDISLWIPAKGNVIRFNSTTGKLLKKLKITKISEMVGKKVPLMIDGKGFHRWDI